MSHLQYTTKSHHLQWNMQQLSTICHQLYRDYCPDSLKHRHNVSLSKVSDESLLVLLLLQAELGIKSQRHFYRICQLFPCGESLKEVVLIVGTVKKFNMNHHFLPYNIMTRYDMLTL